MPGFPFATPVTLEELWANILYDLGAPSYGSAGGPKITMHDILLQLDNGLFGVNLGAYGDGSDGAVTFDGTTTVLGLAPSSSVYTLTRDIFLANNSIINSGVTIKPAGYRIFCQGLLLNNGTISGTGNAAAANVAGAAQTFSATLSPTSTTIGAAGAAGGTGAGGSGGAPGSNSTGGTGGTGGTAGANAGGSGGLIVALTAAQGSPRYLGIAALGRNGGSTNTGVNVLSGGSGGGAGGGDSTNNSGAGGGGAIGVYVAALRIAGTGTITCKGGAGGNANATGNSAGGGGGGGGWVIVISRSVQPVSINSSGPLITGQTIDVSGGAGGNGTGTGTAGAAGAAGAAYLLQA